MLTIDQALIALLDVLVRICLSLILLFDIAPGNVLGRLLFVIYSWEICALFDGTKVEGILIADPLVVKLVLHICNVSIVPGRDNLRLPVVRGVDDFWLERDGRDFVDIQGLLLSDSLRR